MALELSVKGTLENKKNMAPAGALRICLEGDGLSPKTYLVSGRPGNILICNNAGKKIHIKDTTRFHMILNHMKSRRRDRHSFKPAKRRVGVTEKGTPIYPWQLRADLR